MKLLQAIAVVGCCCVLGGSFLLFSYAASPFLDAGKAKVIAEIKMDELGGGELIEFQHLRGDHYRAIYRQGQNRIDVHVESGKARVQTGLPLCNAKASR